MQRLQVLRPQPIRPPQIRVADIELRVVLRADGDPGGLSRRQLHLLRHGDCPDGAFERTRHRRAAAVLQVREQRQVRLIQAGIDLRHHLHVAHGHRAAGQDVHIAHQPHVLVGRQRVPIHVCDGEVVFRGREHFDRQGIGARYGDARNVKLEHAVHTAHLVRAGNLPAVEPDVGAAVDGIEVQPQPFAPQNAREMKLGPIPPRNRKRAVRRHGEVGEIVADVARHTRKGPQVHSKVGIRIHLLIHQRANHRGRHAGRVPIADIETYGRDFIAFLRRLR